MIESRKIIELAALEVMVEFSEQNLGRQMHEVLAGAKDRIEQLRSDLAPTTEELTEGKNCIVVLRWDEDLRSFVAVQTTTWALPAAANVGGHILGGGANMLRTFASASEGLRKMQDGLIAKRPASGGQADD